MNKTGYKLKFDFSCFILSQLISPFSFLLETVWCVGLERVV